MALIIPKIGSIFSRNTFKMYACTVQLLYISTVHMKYIYIIYFCVHTSEMARLVYGSNILVRVKNLDNLSG